jgi:UDP-glucose:(heptosyl)LPS alpha-1,3-glucosyltransferase
VRLAFALYRYTPFGGLERSFHAIAAAAQEAGHEVSVFTRSWQGPRPEGWTIETLAVGGWTNVGRDRAFAAALAQRVASGAFDARIGFNRLPGLDVFYAADPCLASSPPERGTRLLAEALVRRRATRLAWERDAAAPGGHAHLLLLTERERERFARAHGTPPERLHVLPPGLRSEFLVAGEPASDARAALGLPSGALVVLAVGSDFRRKGLDRTLAACARLPAELRERVWIVVVGAGDRGGAQRLARRLGIEARLRLVGGREDVLGAYRAADLLVHPAREEPGGTVVLEAASQGLPVLASDAVGYAGLLARAGAARVLTEPLEARGLAAEIAGLLANEGARRHMGSAGHELARCFPMADRTRQALEVIENAALERLEGSRR